MTDHRTALDTALREGQSPKEYAASAGISVSWAYRLAWEIGFRSIYLSEYERQLIQDIRRKAT